MILQLPLTVTGWLVGGDYTLLHLVPVQVTGQHMEGRKLETNVRKIFPVRKHSVKTISIFLFGFKSESPKASQTVELV